ncbi:hypothetical protein HHX38_22830 [Streptomyces sp. PKU-MA01144]|uniref:hypothetical protein n=1 Tax=Streptomyces TaxID=1883 RepID=UPI00147A16CD|nr:MULTISPECIES: hypothetical protein [Streptomyces]MCY0982246.1 hypothetical protein [Streptomyces tirandamycinicus]NNJ06937.1 hypothetical protein [Streptomyces sp. PKU-MA01144]
MTITTSGEAMAGAVERELPATGSLSQAQQRGIDCVFCGITLRAGSAIDLGPRPLRIADYMTRWFPRSCRRCGQSSDRP